MSASVFGDGGNYYHDIPVAIRFRDEVCGGKPLGLDVYASHVRRKTGITDEMELRRLVLGDLEASGIFDEGIDVQEYLASLSEGEMYEVYEEAAKKFANDAITGFFKDSEGRPYIENYQVKAAIKEAVSINYPYQKGKPKGAWGATKKSPKDYAIERIAINPRRLILADNVDGVKTVTGQVSGPTGKRQVVSRYEYVENAEIDFTIRVPKDPAIGGEFDAGVWENLWTWCQDHGLGAARSSGSGAFDVIRFGEMVVADEASERRLEAV